MKTGLLDLGCGHMVKVKYIVGVITITFTVLSTWAFDVFPWPGYRSAAAFDKLEATTQYLHIKDVKRDLHESQWRLIEIEEYHKEKGYDHINDAPITVQKIFHDKKAHIEELKQKLNILVSK